MSEPIILCENLVKIYKLREIEVVALQGLDLRIEPGEIVALVGSSGSGKTSLLNVLGGLDRPSAGRALVAGNDLLKQSERALTRYRRRVVGFVWQQKARNLVPYLNSIQNIELPMRMSGLSRTERREWANELIETVGLTPRRHHRLGQLSGGEQQRVAIAVALANRPALLLADEPTGELDSNSAASIFGTFRALNRAYGLTIVIVSHDQTIARHVDRVVAIRDGKTSSETRRREEEVPANGSESTAHAEYEELLMLDSAGRVQVPLELRERYGIGNRVRLEEHEDGVLLRPVAESTMPARRSLTTTDEPPPPPPSRFARVGRLFRRNQKSGPSGD